MQSLYIFLPRLDNQVKSKELDQVATQKELDLFRQPETNTYPLEIIRKFPNSGKAFTAACDSCSLADQTIYEFVGIDAGTFSKMKKGMATLQADDLVKFCYAVNNRIYPEWLAYQLGCTLVEIQSEAERQRDQEKARADKLADENRLLRSLVTTRTA